MSYQGKAGSASCTTSRGYFKNNNAFYTTPQVGDQIFFWDDKKTRVCHTGLVIGLDSSYIYTAEGNTSSAKGVVPNGGCVRLKKYSRSYGRLAGFGRPKYSSVQNTGSGYTSLPVVQETIYKIPALSSFNARTITNPPGLGNKYFYDKTVNPWAGTEKAMPNDVAYAWGRFYEVSGERPKLDINKMAKYWFANT